MTKSAWMLLAQRDRLVRGGIRRRRPRYVSPALRRMLRHARQARARYPST